MTNTNTYRTKLDVKVCMKTVLGQTVQLVVTFLLDRMGAQEQLAQWSTYI